MRLYTFMHVYISSIQQGIQTAHIVGELNNEYSPMVVDWQQEHKTIIVCNGGNSKSIKELIAFFCDRRNPYPFAGFYEDEDSMEGMCTGVGIILPEEIYEAKMKSVPIDSGGFVEIGYEFENKIYTCTTYEYELIKRIKSAPLAR